MASSSTNPRSKRGRADQSQDEQNRNQVFGNEPYRTQFVDATHNFKFNDIARRVNAAQKFVDIPTLKTLHIYEGVKTLFKNIHWEGVLKLGDESYEVLTCEFLSSLTHDKRAQTISFRLCNQNHTMHVDQLCEIIGAPTDYRTTYGTTRGLSGYHREKERFWTAITGRYEYDSSNAKAAEIIHPVLKVCYRILASVIFPQEDNNKASQYELEILWCMVNCPDKTPHFGHWIILKLLKVAKSSNSPVHCGGMVTIIARHLGLRIPPGLATMRGERWLNESVLTQMHVFRRESNITTWLVAGQPYLEIDSHNKSLLKLARRTSTFDWCLVSNLGAAIPAPESEREDEDDEEADDQGPEDIPSSSNTYAEYHRLQMTEMRRLHGSYRELHDNYGQLHEDMETLDSDVRDLRLTLDTHVHAQETHNSRVNTYMNRQMAQQDAMFQMLQNLNTNFGGSSSSHQPPSQQQPTTLPYPYDGQWGNWDQQPQQPPSTSGWRNWPFGPPNQ